MVRVLAGPFTRRMRTVTRDVVPRRANAGASAPSMNACRRPAAMPMLTSTRVTCSGPKLKASSSASAAAASLTIGAAAKPSSPPPPPT